MINLRVTCLIIGIALNALSYPVLAADSVTEEVAASVASAMERPYRQIYTGSSCVPKVVGGRWYIKCSPSDITGGLWTVAPGPVLVTVNGKAKQHADSLDPVVIDDKTVPIKKWTDIYPDEFPDVGKALKAFE